MGNTIIHDATFIDILDFGNGICNVKLSPNMDKIVCIKKSNPKYKQIYEMLKSNHIYTFELYLKSNSIYYIENVKMLQIYDLTCKIKDFIDVTNKYKFTKCMYIMTFDDNHDKYNKKIIINENEKKYIDINKTYKMTYSKHPIEDLYEVINFVEIINKKN